MHIFSFQWIVLDCNMENESIVEFTMSSSEKNTLWVVGNTRSLNIHEKKKPILPVRVNERQD